MPAFSIIVELGVFDTAIRYDAYFNNTTSLYFRGGVGYWMMDSQINTQISNSESGFYPLGEVGFNYQATPHVYLNLGYKYSHQLGNHSVGEFDTHSVLAGVTYHFKGKHVNEPLKEQAISQQNEFVPSLEHPVVPLELVLQGGHFAFDSSRVIESDKLKQQLEQTAMQLQENADIHIEVTGHTDSMGSIEYNRKLSKQRADAVAALLIERGVTQQRITTIGKGASEPIANNSTESGRAQNRRVEVKEIRYE